jgi:hypothetical protein
LQIYSHNIQILRGGEGREGGREILFSINYYLLWSFLEDLILRGIAGK